MDGLRERVSDAELDSALANIDAKILVRIAPK